MSRPIRPWRRLASRLRGDFRVFRVHEHTMQDPRDDAERTFFVLDAPDWVNVVPVLPDGRLVMVEQYRHGRGETTLEIPGGMIDPDDAGPCAAAQRELREETGYAPERIEAIGVVAPNPAIQNNRCHTCLAHDVRLAGRQALGGSEDIAVRHVAHADVAQMIDAGRITHALTIAAFYFYDRWLCRTDPPR